MVQKTITELGNTGEQTMTIQEAIRSGKPFRRKGWDWMKVYGKRIGFFSGATVPTLDTIDILATDWMVNPMKQSNENSR